MHSNLTWRDSGAARAVVWAGLILMVTSLLLHKVGLAADSSTASDYTWAYQITGMVKHGAELAGWMLIHRFRIIFEQHRLLEIQDSMLWERCLAMAFIL